MAKVGIKEYTKAEDKEIENSEDVTEISTKPAEMQKIQWSKATYSSRKLLEDYALRHKLPLIVKAVHGYQGENAVETIDHEQVVLLKGWEKQQRVLVRDNHGRLLSIPLEWSVKFKVNEKRWKRSKPKYLKEILQHHRPPIRMSFDKLPKWRFKVGKKDVTNLKFGGLVLVDVYTEHFLLGMPINNGFIELEKEKMMTLPIYTDAYFVLAEGIESSTDQEWIAIQNMYNNSVKQIRFSDMYGTEDALLYKKEYVHFNKTLGMHLRLESAGKAQSGLKQDFSDSGRLLPKMNMEVNRSEKTVVTDINDNKVEETDNEKRNSTEIKEAGSATVLVNGKEPQQNENSKQHTVTTVRTHAQAEEEAGHSTDSGVVDNNKDSPSYSKSSDTHGTTVIHTSQPYIPQSSTHIINLPPSENVGVRHIRYTYGSNENLAHDQDAISGVISPWDYGGRYRSLVTVSRAGSDIVSDVEDDFDYRAPVRRSHHLSLPRKEQFVYPRYGTVTTNVPSARKPYITRNTEVHHMTMPSSTRHYSLKRIHGSGPMRYYIPDVSTDRLYDSLRYRAPVRHRGLSGDFRDTMSDVGVPAYRIPFRSSLNINIPEDSLSTIDYNSNYMNRSSYGDDYDVVDHVFVDRPHSHRHVKKRSASARRHSDRHSDFVTVEPQVNRQIRTHEIGGRVHAPVVPDVPTRAHNGTHVKDDTVRVLRVSRRSSGKRPAQRTSSFVDVGTGEVTRKRSTGASTSTDMTSRSFEYRNGSLDRSRQGRSASLGRPRHTRAVPVIYSDSDEEHRTRRPSKRNSAPIKHNTNSLPKFASERHSDWSKAYDQPIRDESNVLRISEETITKQPAYHYENQLDYNHNQEIRIETLSGKQMSSKGPIPSKINYGDTFIAEVESKNGMQTRPAETYSKVTKTHSDFKYTHNDPKEISVDINNSRNDAFAKDMAFESSYLGQINIDSQNSSQIDKPKCRNKTETQHTSYSTAEINVHSSSSIPHTIPAPPPPPPISPQSPTSNAVFTQRTTSSAAVEKREKETTHDLMQNELKTKLTKRTESMEARDRENVSQSGEDKVADSSNVVMRDKSSFAKAIERSSANSLRQVYALQRSSLEGLISMAKTDSQFDDILNSNESKASESHSHDTLKSSGYGSVSSKPEIRETATTSTHAKSTTSKAYLDPLPSPTRAKHNHTNPDNPWLFEGADSVHEKKQARESFISIRELDEYLKQQSAGAESDTESVKHFETSELGVTDLELTHL